MKKNIIITTFIFLASCGMLRKMETFSKCDFKLKSIESITVAGVNVQKVTGFSNLNILDAARIIAAYSSKSLPLDLTANIFVTNPNSSPASMTRSSFRLFALRKAD